MKRALGPALFALMMASVAWAGGDVHPEKVKGLGKSPHGDPGACTACHAPGAAVGQVGSPLPIVATCRGCHPTADMHPVGVAPTPEIQPPAGWPLENGKIVCSTCHAEPAHGGASASLTAPYHRGGPYPDIRQLCYTCHARTKLERSNPHHPPNPRDPSSQVCGACHATEPDTGARPEDAKLRIAPREACLTCHPADFHLGTTQHLDKVLPTEMRATLPPTMALPADGQIQCWTCHEVHGDGPPPTPSTRHRKAPKVSWATAPTRAPSPNGHGAMLALPQQQLCQACHGDGPK